MIHQKICQRVRQKICQKFCQKNSSKILSKNSSKILSKNSSKNSSKNLSKQSSKSSSKNLSQVIHTIGTKVTQKLRNSKKAQMTTKTTTTTSNLGSQKLRLSTASLKTSKYKKIRIDKTNIFKSEQLNNLFLLNIID